VGTDRQSSVAPGSEYLEATRLNAIHKWKWRHPWLAATLGVLPLGMLYTSVGAAIVYFLVSIAWLSWAERPRWGSILIMLASGVYAYQSTRWRNAALEYWKYGLPGTGTQNPKGMKPIAPPDTDQSKAA
jgi:hypothetical protein